jgi:hypothetical protein
MTKQEGASRRADAAGAKTLSPWRGARSMLGVGETQPWLWGDMPRSGISCAHAPCPVAECGDENAAQHVGWTASTIQLSQERCVPASLAMHRSSPGHCRWLLWRIGSAHPVEACVLRTERQRALCAGARPLSLCPPRGGSAAQAAGLGEPSGARTTLELSAHHSHRPYPDAHLCACMRVHVRPGSPRDGPTAPARCCWSPRSPPPSSPPSATSPAHAAATQARCVRVAKNRTCACVHALQPPRAPLAAAAAASALPQPTVHATHGLTRLVRAALAVVRAAAVPLTRRQQGCHRPPRAGPTGRCSVGVPPQARAGGRGRRQRVKGCGWRARSARAAADGRDAVVGPLGGALALVPVWGARGGREIATVRAPRRPRGGSRRVGAGVGVLVGRPSAS